MRFVTIFKRFTKVTKTFLILFGINICLKTIISNVIISCKSRVWLVLVGPGQVQVIDLPGEGGHRVEVRPLQAVDLLLRGGRHRPAAFQHHTHAKVPLLHLPVQVKVQNTMNCEKNLSTTLQGGCTPGAVANPQRSWRSISNPSRCGNFSFAIFHLSSCQDGVIIIPVSVMPPPPKSHQSPAAPFWSLLCCAPQKLQTTKQWERDPTLDIPWP